MTNMVNTRITVKVSTGETLRTDWSKESPESLEEIRYLLSMISDMEKFDITTAKGLKVFINPAHVVYTYVEAM